MTQALEDLIQSLREELQSYGEMLANNDRVGVMSVYHGDCSGDCGTIRNNGGTRRAAGPGSSTGAKGAGNTAAANTPPNAPANNAPNGDDKAKEDAKQKAKDALEKGKKALKGLFGGG